MKVGVLGCGYLGSRHARKLAVRSDVSELHLYDVIPDRAAALAAEIAGAEDTLGGSGRRDATGGGVAAGARVPRVRVAGSVAELNDAVQAVVVGASTGAHAELTLQALRAGCHVLVEKPIAATLEEADRMIAGARAAGCVLSVGHVERFNPVIRALEGRIQAPRFVEAHRLAAFQPRSLDIDVVLDLMIHDIDLVLHFTRELPSSIEAAGTSVLSGRVDIANARLAFPNRSVANLTASRVSLNRTRKIRFFMPETYVSVDLGERRAERYTLTPAGSASDGAPGAPAVPGTPPAAGARAAAAGPEAFLERIRHESVTGTGDALEAEQDRFLRAARGEVAPLVPGEEGRAALAVALRILSRLKEQEI